MKVGDTKFLDNRYLLLTLFFAVSAVVLWNAKTTGLYVDIELLSLGEKAPNFKLERLDGRKHQLKDMHGAVVWIIFGRTSDDKTQIQLKEAREIANKYKEYDLRILFLSQSQGPTELQKYVDAEGCAAAILIDKGDRAAAKYHVDFFPTSYLVDKTGTIRAVYRGVVRADEKGFTRIVGELLRSGMKNAPDKR